LISPAYLLGAFLLDLAIGDPRWIPHPVIIIGRAISGTEALLRRFFNTRREKLAGVILTAAIVLLTSVIALVINRLLLSVFHGFTMVATTLIFIYLVSTTLALRGLISSCRLVIKAVDQGDTGGARQKLAMIVGRDTEHLKEDEILRATIETASENLSDGFVAPLLYLSLGGLPLGLAYKAVNTLDSMVGYKNDKYIKLGWASARLDDIANYIPARLTGLAIVAATFFVSIPGGIRQAAAHAGTSLRIMRRDGRNHTSPNSGISEAAMAGALGLRLGGPSVYGGKTVVKPYIGDLSSTDYRLGADRSLVITITAACLSIAVALAAAFALQELL
jgi:adenosylcobinamide-phosphate synthase